MTNKQLEQRLAEAVTSLKTDLPFERIVQAIPADRTDTPIPLPRRSPRRYITAAAVAACLVALLGVGGLWHHLKNASDPPPITPPVAETADTVIDIDINPSIEMTVDDTDRIAAVTAVNRDGQQVLDGLDLAAQPLSAGVKKLFNAMVAHGYVAEESNRILVTIQSADQADADRLHAIINDGVDAVMEQHQLTASVTNQTVEAFDTVTQFAQKYDISNGKAAFVLRMAEQLPTLDATTLAEYSFSALAAIAQHQNIPLSELVDYDAKDDLWALIVSALSEEVAQAETRLGVPLLSVEEAKAIALKGIHNDYIAENALFVRVELLWEDDTPIYRLELVSLGYLDEYAINAIDGSFQNPGGSTTSTTKGDVIRSTLSGGGTRVPIDRPPEKTTESPTTTTPTVVAPTRPTTPSGNGGISTEQAKAIVFGRLGITEAEAQNVSVGQHPTDQEMSVWFIYNSNIHCVYLNSVTGNVTKSVYLPLDIAVENYRINEWEALTIALIHSGMQEAECGEITIMYSVHNDAPFIDIVWMANNCSYYYRIDGMDGAIVTANVIPLGSSHTPPDFVIP